MTDKSQRFGGHIIDGYKNHLWVTLSLSNTLVRVGYDGSQHYYPVPTPQSEPNGVSIGPDSNIWFTEGGAGKIGKMTLSGVFTEYPLPDPSSAPDYITNGPDGRLWFTEYATGKIGAITPNGIVTEYTPPTPGWQAVGAIVTGPDGNLWFVEGGLASSYVVSVTPTGNFTTFPLPRANAGPYIVRGPDDNLWFDEIGEVGRISVSGQLTEYPAPVGTFPAALGFTSRTRLFVVLADSGKLLDMDTRTGSQKVHVLPLHRYEIDDLAVGQDGNVWMPDIRTPTLDIFVLHKLTVSPSSVSLPGIGSTQMITVSEVDRDSRAWSAKSGNPKVVTVASGPAIGQFVLTAQGQGSTTVVVSDNRLNTFSVPVTVF